MLLPRTYPGDKGKNTTGPQSPALRTLIGGLRLLTLTALLASAACSNSKDEKTEPSDPKEALLAYEAIMNISGQALSYQQSPATVEATVTIDSEGNQEAKNSNSGKNTIFYPMQKSAGKNIDLPLPAALKDAAEKSLADALKVSYQEEEVDGEPVNAFQKHIDEGACKQVVSQPTLENERLVYKERTEGEKCPIEIVSIAKLDKAPEDVARTSKTNADLDFQFNQETSFKVIDPSMLSHVSLKSLNVKTSILFSRRESDVDTVHFILMMKGEDVKLGEFNININGTSHTYRKDKGDRALEPGLKFLQTVQIDFKAGKHAAQFGFLSKEQFMSSNKNDSLRVTINQQEVTEPETQELIVNSLDGLSAIGKHLPNTSEPSDEIGYEESMARMEDPSQSKESPRGDEVAAAANSSQAETEGISDEELLLQESREYENVDQAQSASSTSIE